MTRGWVEVSPRQGTWVVKVEGESPVRSRHTFKFEAVEAGRALARQLRTELVIKRADGTIEDRDSYGNDPFPPRDRVH